MLAAIVRPIRAGAHEAALEQPKIDREHVIILAQGGGTKLLGSAYGLFARLQAPCGVALVCSRLDNTAVQAITTRLHIIQGSEDWSNWQTYAEAASSAHQDRYPYGATCFVADNADHTLTDQGTGRFHEDALVSLTEWLTTLCPVSS